MNAFVEHTVRHPPPSSCALGLWEEIDFNINFTWYDTTSNVNYEPQL